ncbi:MAG: hypothetical protein AAFU73_13440 [Planctomycetota bacterium]
MIRMEEVRGARAHDRAPLPLLALGCLLFALAAAARAWPAAQDGPAVQKGPSVQKSSGAPAGEGPALLTLEIIGASVSAGYGNAAELGTRVDVRLGGFLDAFLGEADAVQPVDRGSRWLFRSPRVLGANQASLAAAAAPDAVVAIDFLFWYAYGIGFGADERRSVGLERGLRALDAIDAPLVVGDLPRVEHALEGVGPFGGPLIVPEMLPTEDERARMNARIREWARTRVQVRVIDLGAFTARCVGLETLELRGNSWTPNALDDVLQPDLLHPRARGSLWVALAVWDALSELDAAPEELDWSVERASARLETRLAPRRARAHRAASGQGASRRPAGSRSPSRSPRAAAPPTGERGR